MAERLGNRANNQKVAGSIPDVLYYVVSLSKALHPTCLGGKIHVIIWGKNSIVLMSTPETTKMDSCKNSFPAI